MRWIEIGAAPLELLGIARVDVVNHQHLRPVNDDALLAAIEARAGAAGTGHVLHDGLDVAFVGMQAIVFEPLCRAVPVPVLEEWQIDLGVRQGTRVGRPLHRQTIEGRRIAGGALDPRTRCSVPIEATTRGEAVEVIERAVELVGGLHPHRNDGSGLPIWSGYSGRIDWSATSTVRAETWADRFSSVIIVNSTSHRSREGGCHVCWR